MNVSEFITELLRKHHLDMITPVITKIGSRSSLFKLKLSLYVVHLCCEYGDCISHF